MTAPLLRRPDWEERLHALIARAAEAPHAWGSHDCVMFPAGVVKAITGFDAAKGHRGAYRSAAGASRYLRAQGWTTPADAADAILPRIHPARARRGDLLLHDGHIGVCIGGQGLFVGQEGGSPGLVRVGLLDCDAAWTVG